MLTELKGFIGEQWPRDLARRIAEESDRKLDLRIIPGSGAVLPSLRSVLIETSFLGLVLFMFGH